ncbi:MFS transporter [Paenibacillus sp. UNC451MF]|uniref:MFS transporter n=1 Tax=Paenibacillus sp. UNC451MF TaxID=1449063 RepID=UPI000561007D|nr:MFS transporter [Paenibacillus sp. UNC451MF]
MSSGNNLSAGSRTSSVSTTTPQSKFLGWSLAILAFAQLIYSIDINIVFVALPELGKDLGFSEQSLQWVVSAYTIFCGGFLLLGGRAADLFGQRRVFISALILFAIASLLGGLAWSPIIMIIARAIQGIGGAMLFPATLSLLNRLFEEGPRRNRALGIWGGAGASGLTIGSLLGGILTNAFGWESVFYVNVLFAGVAAFAALLIIPRDETCRRIQSFDLPGALTFTGAATLLVYVLVQGPGSGWGSVSVIICMVLSFLLFITFAQIQIRSKAPLMPPFILRNRSLVAGMTITFIFMGTFGAIPYFLTILFQNVHQYSALQTGLAFIVPSLAIASGTQLGERLATRLGMRSTLLTGMIIGIIGTALIPLGAYVDSSYLLILPGLVISGVGQGIVWTGMWIAASTGVEQAEQGVASGMASTTLNIGNAIGLAFLIAIANSQLHGQTGLSLQAAVATGARTAFYIAAAGLVLGIIITFFLPRKK